MKQERTILTEYSIHFHNKDGYIIANPKLKPNNTYIFNVKVITENIESAIQTAINVYKDYLENKDDINQIETIIIEKQLIYFTPKKLLKRVLRTEEPITIYSVSNKTYITIRNFIKPKEETK